jgi:hypothetical protein
MARENNNNALKHGAFAEAIMLPKDDAQEFAALHAALIEEWEPDGPSEHDKVFSVATNLWRKRRFKRWLQNEIDRGQRKVTWWRRQEEREDEKLITFLEESEAGLSIREDDLPTKLPFHLAERVKKDLPRNKFDSDADWLKAVYHEVCLILDSRVELPDIHRLLSDEFLSQRELAFEERIDAKIARDLKELGQMKTMKAIGIGKRSAPAAAERMKVVASPPIEARQSEPPSLQDAEAE